MRADAAQAERRYEVREAARGWERGGAIGAEARAAIDAAYPDDRARLGPVFRVLVFGFTIVVVSSLLGLFGLVLSGAFERAGWLLLLLFGSILAGATEFQLGPLHRRQGGTEAATASLAIVYLTGGLLWLVFEGRHLSVDASINIALIVVALLFAPAGHRWGYLVFAVVAGCAVFLLLARWPFGRLLWILVPVVVAPALLRAADSARLAPSHRRACQALAAVALVCLYLAVHLGSWDRGIVEMVTGDWQVEPRRAAPRPFFVLATALLPVLIIGWGIRSRGRLLINLGLVSLLASIVTLRAYVHVAPAWLALLVGGGGAIVLALAIRRYLDSGPNQERHGFTAEPLFTDPERRSALEVAAGVVNLSPAARPAAKPDYAGGGGRSGGAGATGEF